MTHPLRQLGALLALRWQMLRTPGARLATVLTALAVLWLVRAALGSGELLEQAVLATAQQIAPGALLGFGVLAVVAPLTAGGGHDVVPSDQLIAYPVRSSTQFLGGLLLAPANLVWAVHLLVLAGLSAALTVGGTGPLGGLTMAGSIAFLTVAGQALAWLVAGARRSRGGRRAVAAVWAALALTAVAVVQGGRIGSVVDLSGAHRVVGATVAGGRGDLSAWAGPTAALLLGCLVAGWLGFHACRWAGRQPSDDRACRHSAPVRRRSPRRSALRELVAVDRASAWRAPAVRRGGLVLLVLPGVAAGTLHVPWDSLIVLPGLVAAGAGLLFGVNAFALDASGSVWLASLPVDPWLLLRSKLVVVGETVLGAVAVAAVAGMVRSPGDPTAAQLSAVAGAALACTALVVALCLRSSLRRPHRADLHGPRDAVAPPGALAAASARLALPCSVTGMVIAASSRSGSALLPLLLATLVVLAALLSVHRSARLWSLPAARARVVHAVGSG